MGEWEPVKGDRTVWQDPPTPEKCLKCLRNVWQDPPTPEREKKSLREVWRMDLVHCCTLSLCYLGAEMIITETQISIQRSSSWATNWDALTCRRSGHFAFPVEPPEQPEVTNTIWGKAVSHLFFHILKRLPKVPQGRG